MLLNLIVEYLCIYTYATLVSLNPLYIVICLTVLQCKIILYKNLFLYTFPFYINTHDKCSQWVFQYLGTRLSNIYLILKSHTGVPPKLFKIINFHVF